MKRGGVNIIMYGILTILMGVIIMGSVFALSVSIRRSNAKEMSILLSDSILSKIENKIIDLKSISAVSNSNSTAVMNLPSKIGTQNYNIVGSNDNLIIRVYGQDSIIRQKKIENVYIKGIGTPPDITLEYNVNTNYVTIK